MGGKVVELNIMKCNILITEEYQWKKLSKNGVDVFFKGGLSSDHIDVLFSLPFKDDVFISKYVYEININFAIIIYTENFCMMATDKIRSVPIIYANSHNAWYVDCTSHKLLNIIDEQEIDEQSVLSFAMSGYTTGDNTIYKSISSLMAGQLVILRDLYSIKKIQYYRYMPEPISSYNEKDLENKLRQVTLNILQKTIDSLNGRQVVIPLSAGNDSRLIASGLKHLGYENVKCYSYGFKDFESDTSKIVAEKLGYEWKLVELNIKDERAFYRGEEFKKYLNFCDVLTSIPVVRWLSTVRILKRSGWIDKDAIFINGNSGDFISGGHIGSSLYRAQNSESDKNRMSNMFDLFIEKHYKLWGRLYNKKNKKIIKKMLYLEYEKLLSDKTLTVESIFESLEFFHRQSKYVISAQRVYEYYGYEWRIPLWDEDYLKFWSKVPTDLKYKQKLYKSMLFNENWGGVWRIPVNESNVRPKWVIPLRQVAKSFFFIAGNNKEYWHQFEVSVFMYWMDNGRVTTMFPYIEFILGYDIRGVQSLISKNYLKNKELISILN